MEKSHWTFWRILTSLSYQIRQPHANAHDLNSSPELGENNFYDAHSAEDGNRFSIKFYDDRRRKIFTYFSFVVGGKSWLFLVLVPCRAYFQSMTNYCHHRQTRDRLAEEISFFHAFVFFCHPAWQRKVWFVCVTYLSVGSLSIFMLVHKILPQFDRRREKVFKCRESMNRNGIHFSEF